MAEGFEERQNQLIFRGFSSSKEMAEGEVFVHKQFHEIFSGYSSRMCMADGLHDNQSHETSSRWFSNTSMAAGFSEK